MIRLLVLLPLAWAQSPPDTVVTVAARDGFDLVMAIAAGSFALVFLVMLAGVLFVFLQIRSAIHSVGELKDRISTDPAVKSLQKTAGNVEAISEVLRNEVAELSRSVGQLSDRLTQASDRMEERIEDFNALLEVVQGEAEEVFVDTASTARGVRRGLGALQAKRRRLTGERRMPPSSPSTGDGTQRKDDPGRSGYDPSYPPLPDAVPGAHPFDDTER